MKHLIALTFVLAAAAAFTVSGLGARATGLPKGFPAVWNLAAFYLYVLTPPEWVAAAAIAVLVALTFIPVRFVHPLRVRRFRAFNMALLGLWAALAFVAVIENLQPDIYVTAPLAAIAVYFLAVGAINRAA